MERIVLILLLSGSATSSWANSCCGQNPTSYAVLYQRQKAMVITNYSSIATEGRVDSHHEYLVWPESKKRRVDGYQFQAAATVSEWWQVFLATGLLSARYEDDFGTERAQHMTDTQLGLTYEVLPEYAFSAWKPVIYASVFLNLPTGHSIYSPGGLTEGADVTGHEQWGAGAGLTLRKVIHPLVFVMQAKALRLRGESFGKTAVSGFYDLSLAQFITYNSSWWGLSGTLGWTWNQLQSRRISQSAIPSGVSEVHTLSASLQKGLTDEVSVSLSVSDQTLWGEAKNTLLNRTYSMSLNYNFL